MSIGPVKLYQMSIRLTILYQMGIRSVHTYQMSIRPVKLYRMNIRRASSEKRRRTPTRERTSGERTSGAETRILTGKTSLAKCSRIHLADPLQEEFLPAYIPSRGASPPHWMKRDPVDMSPPITAQMRRLDTGDRPREKPALQCTPFLGHFIKFT